ncbi:DUF1398 domain-containing protein [Emticicia sp. TH156]|uniref:DUF1398 domain-containing protein n=1 Tax=Emticicia sp. TH156 TaxID=2067454 RepID=UPI000C7863F3|nr:DUF1398 family protein [Emticicia sp. TH156]PLK43004.1 phage envelope protein [Emticicia sp. TH156]
MFTLGQIKEAHTKVKSGADFPKYIKEIAGLGVLYYTVYVIDGHTFFVGADAITVISEPKYEALTIADESNVELFNAYLKAHQKGESDYFTFCRHAAETGIEKWAVDVINLTCTYSDKMGNELIIEAIPEV